MPRSGKKGKKARRSPAKDGAISLIFEIQSTIIGEPAAAAYRELLKSERRMNHFQVAPHRMDPKVAALHISSPQMGDQMEELSEGSRSLKFLRAHNSKA